ncbi:hypothetical protein [Anaerophilus nitritogenes]|uniref:hypothetical protein n=1 Tax=Anaerophilus nitritogenes TaxID=2498136 RepID=UPI00101D4CB1|nr:hypothetical protein [Anaerophilus nitritogenes]
MGLRVFIECNNVFRFFIQKNENWKPPMQSGRFFLSYEKGKKAVIGKEMVKYVKENNGIKHITFQDENYEVIGIMGASFASQADYLVLLQSEKIPMMNEAKIVVDSDRKSIVDQIIKHIRKNHKTISYIKSETKGLSRTSNATFFYHLLVMDSCLLIICSIFVYLRYWYEKEKATMYVKFIFGVPQNIMIAEYIKEISLNILTASFIGNSIVLLKGYNSIHIIKQIVIVDMGLLISSCIFLLFFIIKASIHNKLWKRGIAK